MGCCDRQARGFEELVKPDSGETSEMPPCQADIRSVERFVKLLAQSKSEIWVFSAFNVSKLVKEKQVVIPSAIGLFRR